MQKLNFKEMKGKKPKKNQKNKKIKNKKDVTYNSIRYTGVMK